MFPKLSFVITQLTERYTENFCSAVYVVEHEQDISTVLPALKVLIPCDEPWKSTTVLTPNDGTKSDLKFRTVVFSLKQNKPVKV